ncbi:hypothetical protein Ptr902_03905 [Pyrenophora tritici-repentis]|nr:hypothetical protein Ptr902_03905 [Pyrenophora tritici-repentis]
MGIFQETWKDIPAFRPHKLPDGTFEYVRLKSAGPHQANPEVVATRDTGAFVEALILHQPAGTDVLGANGYKTAIVDNFRFFAEYGYADGNPKVKTPAELGIKTTSLEEFSRGQSLELKSPLHLAYVASDWWMLQSLGSLLQAMTIFVGREYLLPSFVDPTALPKLAAQSIRSFHYPPP